MSFHAYVESQVLCATPLELVTILYQGAIQALESARMHLAAGNISARASDVNRACALIGELVRSVHDAPNPSFARQLRELYAYILRRIQDGHFLQLDAPFAEAIHLLNTLLEGWREICQPPQSHQTDSCSETYQPLQCSF
ncbi:MAG: flagellar protein FliS [Bryobacteraceae bacterium]|nr:flagellar protein FliS [Bryobacteraceae bacterium]MDW8380061.1 flagellar export chaperone FliS [Bryobacterales bacterium]